MKNIKKISMFMLLCVMFASIFTSCGKPKISPEESAKIYLDVIFKDNKTNMEKIGMKEEDYNTVIKNKKDAVIAQLGESSLFCALTDEFKHNDTFINNILNGVSKLEYEVTPVSINNDTAIVSVKMNYFQLRKITKNGQEKMLEKIKANPSMTQDEILKETYKIIGEEFKKGPATDDTVIVKVGLIKKIIYG